MVSRNKNINPPNFTVSGVQIKEIKENYRSSKITQDG